MYSTWLYAYLYMYMYLNIFSEHKNFLQTSPRSGLLWPTTETCTGSLAAFCRPPVTSTFATSRSTSRNASLRSVSRHTSHTINNSVNHFVTKPCKRFLWIFKCRKEILYSVLIGGYFSGAWAYNSQLMNITNASNKIHETGFKVNGEWEVLHTYAEHKTIVLPTSLDTK